MYHPIFLDPTKLRDSDIESKISELSRKYNLAIDLGKYDVGEQIVLIIDQLKEEQAARRRAKEQKNNTELIKDLIKTH